MLHPHTPSHAPLLLAQLANSFNEEDMSRRIRLIMKLRRSGINDTAVLSAMEAVPRERFVPAAFQDQAYDDTALPIACGQTISQPTIVAWMTQALEVNSRSRVLEIGTGSGYQTTILAKLARMVYTIERHRELYDTTQARFKEMGLTNVATRLGDGSKGWKEAAPYDRILAAAAAEDVPPALLDQLSPGGIMVLPVGPASNQILLRVRKDESGNIHTEHLMDVRFVPLVEGK